MKKSLLIHITLAVIAGTLFFGLGTIDKNRYNKASISHKPVLLFSHEKAIAHDGGSIHWDSIIYSAHEARRMRVWEEDGKQVIADGFQGKWWMWKYHNLVWISLILLASLLCSIITLKVSKNTPN